MQVLRNYFPCSNARARYVSDYHVVYHKADDLTIHLTDALCPQDALFQVVGIAPDLQHVDVVVGLQQHRVQSFQMLHRIVIVFPQICRHRHRSAAALQTVAGGFIGVMGNGKGLTVTSPSTKASSVCMGWSSPSGMRPSPE